jgi:NAD-dependent dihydropyrimidine dehydrogenase PreA subunit
LGLLYLRKVSTLRLDGEACTGCKVCTDVCPRAVLEMREGRAFIASLDSCIECGACALNCAFDALSVKTGAGCASGILNGMLGRKSACCVVDEDDTVCTTC